MNRIRRFLLLACAFATFASQPLYAQNDPSEPQGRPREIRSKDFTQNRPTSPPQAEPPPGTGGTPAPQRPPRPTSGPGTNKDYRLVKSLPRRRPRRNPAPSVAKRPNVEPMVTSGPVMTEQVGITMWRLRPATSGESGPYIYVKGASGVPTASVPVRVGAEHLFSLGDSVRLTVESPRNGYLYVFDRERYADGSLGEAMMIFPTSRMRGGDNKVSAGYLVDIPAWSDSVPYFLLKSGRADYAGELLTFLISPHPLQDFSVGGGPLALARGTIEGLEEQWEVDADLYAMDGGVGETPTEAEVQALGGRPRMLVQTEAVPQTIYRMRVRRDSPFLINIPVSARAR